MIALDEPTSRLSWPLLRELTERSRGRTAAWTQTGLWTLQTLETELGADWPAAVAKKAPGGMAADLAWAPAHVHAFARLLELALRLRLVADVPGRAKLRKAIVRDPRPDVLFHAELQLEVATLASRAGSSPTLEPGPHDLPHPDVAFDFDSIRFYVEARVVLTSDQWRDESQLTHELFEQIRAIESRYDVHVVGEVPRQLADAERRDLLAIATDRARLVSIGATAPPIHFAGAELQVCPRVADVADGLRGPEMRGDSWARIGPRIVDKARRARESGANWLRLDAREGLWQFTHWARKPLAAKLDDLANIVGPSLDGLDGIVMSSGSLQRQGDFNDEDVMLGDGLTASRRLLTPLRVRETLVIPGSTRGRRAAERWRALYSDEPSWLDWGLARVELPPAEEIFAA